MKEIKWGFIGCGEVTERKSGPAFSLVEGSRVVAVMSRHELKAKDYAERHGIRRWYTDAQQTVDDPDVDAIYIATPPAAHTTYAIMAMHAGKPVYIEKPLASTYDDCVRINRVSEQTGVPCFVAYYRRYLPYFQRVKSLTLEGAIGRVLTFSLRFACPPRDLDFDRSERPWRLQSNISGGGYFYDLAPHALDLLQDMFGIITRAHGYRANRAGLYDVEDTISAVFEFESGLSGSGSWCFVGHDSARTDRIDIIGSEGMLSFSVYDRQPITLHQTDGVRTIDVPFPECVQLPIITAVVRHLQGLGTCTCTSVSATPTNWVMDRVLGKI